MAKKDRLIREDWGTFSNKEVIEIVETALHTTKLKFPYVKVYGTCIVVPFGVRDVKIAVTDDNKVGIIYVADSFIQEHYTYGCPARKEMYEYFDDMFFKDGIDKYQTLAFKNVAKFREWFTFERLLEFFHVLNKYDQALGQLCKIVNHTEESDPIFDKNSDAHHEFVKSMMDKLLALKNELILFPISVL